MDTHPHLVVPGWGGSGADHWQTSWERELGAPRVELANWFDPRCEVWTAALDAAVAALARRDPRPPVLVAHSLGCIVVAHWVRATRRPIRAALLVAPADVDQRTALPRLRDFSPLPDQPLPFASLVVTSDDDPYVAIDRARLIARRWGSRLHVVPGGGHLNAASRIGRWREGRSLLAGLLHARELSRAG